MFSTSLSYSWGLESCLSFLLLYHHHLLHGQPHSTAIGYFINLLNRYLLSTYYVPDIVLGGENRRLKKIDENFWAHADYIFVWTTDNKQDKQVKYTIW